jgi:hypothetical protein
MAAEREEPKRVEVGFSGGQTVVLRVSEKAYEGVRKALRNGNGWHELETADGVVALDLGHVVFVKKEPEEHRIGFSGLG